jgi:AcrR family transcriptional regulator
MAAQKRQYRKRQRADSEEQTRRRITESAVDLHGTLGPARTSISAVAEHAGVRRSTIYRHFPDERALFAACSAHWMASNPLPDLNAWRAVRDPDARLELALGQLYAYYRGTEGMMDNLHRDETAVPILKELFSGFRGYLADAGETLIGGRTARGVGRRRLRAAIGHALAFPTWRSLVCEQGLSDVEAAELMCRFVVAAVPQRRG